MYKISDLGRAEDTLWQFLHALRTQDEPGLAALVYAPTLRTWGTRRGSARRALLEGFDLEEAQLPNLRVVHTARVLPGRVGPRGLVAFGLLVSAGTQGIIMGPRSARAIALIAEKGGWRVWGAPGPAEWAAAELVRLPVTEPVQDEALSLIEAEWLLAVAPHLAALLKLSDPTPDDAVVVRAGEGAHSIATIAMLVFALESIGARLVSMGHLQGSIPDAIVQAMTDPDRQLELIETIVVRNVVVHNHVWRMSVTWAADHEDVTLDDSERLYGRETTRYRQAVEHGAVTTRRLGLHVIPTAVRRSDAYRVLAVAVWAFDVLASVDVEGGSLADLPLQVAEGARSLRQIVGAAARQGVDAAMDRSGA